MTTYRTGAHWATTIVRQGDGPLDATGHRSGDELVAVVVNGDAELAERIAALLNADEPNEEPACGCPIVRFKGRSVRHAIGCPERDATVRFSVGVPLDSCTCTAAWLDPACVVHQGRRPRGPKPPPLGPGCICDGSGRTCPRHGVVL